MTETKIVCDSCGTRVDTNIADVWGPSRAIRIKYFELGRTGATKTLDLCQGCFEEAQTRNGNTDGCDRKQAEELLKSRPFKRLFEPLGRLPGEEVERMEQNGIGPIIKFLEKKGLENGFEVLPAEDGEIGSLILRKTKTED